MAVIPAVVTNDARQFWPQFFGTLLGVTSGATNPFGPAWNPLIKYFKVGEGGWINPGTGQVPRTPDPNLRDATSVLDVNGNPYFLQDIDALVDATRSPSQQRYPAASGPNPLPGGPASFQKALTPGAGGSFSFVSPTTLQVTCLLDFPDFNFNNNPSPTSPMIWELGLFSDHPTVSGQELMIAYATFPVEIKNSSKQIENIVLLTF